MVVALIKLVVISDTHRLHKKLEIPDGDILIHCGDWSGGGYHGESVGFAQWITALPHPHKIIVPGNHDVAIMHNKENACALFDKPGVHLLIDRMVEVMGLKIWGSPWVPTFGRWAFMKDDERLAPHWDAIPEGIDILVTHGPPYGIGDLTLRGERAGSKTLREAVFRIRPKLHLFGHIHEDYGMEEHDGVTFINASQCDFMYKPTQPPIVITLEPLPPPEEKAPDA